MVMSSKCIGFAYGYYSLAMVLTRVVIAIFRSVAVDIEGR